MKIKGYRIEVHYTYDDLLSMPDLAVAQADSLKIDTPSVRVWLSRMSPDDGQDPDQVISVERLIDGRWETVSHASAAEGVTI